jgi:tRNA dimethylallyltransferase
MNELITILGPTATGKTKLATSLAAKISGEIISADSRQVYRGMDIGTGKDLNEYMIDGVEIPFYMVDIVDPGYEYNVFEFQRDFTNIFKEIQKRGSKAILCGGSGMYLDSILRAYEMTTVPVNKILRDELEKYTDFELERKLKAYGNLHNTTDITDRKRTLRAIEIMEYGTSHVTVTDTLKNIRSINFGIKYERAVLRKRITERLAYRLDNGMVEEIQNLLKQSLKPEQLIFYGLEYKYVTQFIAGELSFDEMFTKLNTAIHQFAKRQMTWFRRMEKKGIKINWIDGELPLADKLSFILDKIDFKTV